MPFQFAKYQIPLLVLIITATLLGTLIALQDTTVSLYFTILIVSFVLAVLFSMMFNHPKFVIQLIFLALSVRIIAMIILKIFSFQAGLDGFYPGDADSYTYHGDAVKAIMSHAWIQTLEGNLPYTYFTAFLYNLFGIDMNIPQLINLGAAVIIIPLLYELGNRVGGRKGGIAAALLWCLFPSSIFWSVSLLKDTFVVLGMVLSAFLIMGISNQRLIGKEALLGIAGIVITSFMRPQFLLAVALTIGAVILLQFIQGSRHFLRNTLFILLTVGIIGATTAANTIEDSVERSTTTEGTENLYEIALEGGSGIEVVTMFPPEIRWLVQLPFTMFAPFPWQWFSVSQGIYLVSGLEMIFIYIMFYLLWKNRVAIIQNKNSLLLLMLTFTIFIAVSFSLPNMGSIYRYRFAAVTLLFPLVFYNPLRKRRSIKREE